MSFERIEESNVKKDNRDFNVLIDRKVCFLTWRITATLKRIEKPTFLRNQQNKIGKKDTGNKIKKCKYTIKNCSAVQPFSLLI